MLFSSPPPVCMHTLLSSEGTKPSSQPFTTRTTVRTEHQYVGFVTLSFCTQYIPIHTHTHTHTHTHVRAHTHIHKFTGCTQLPLADDGTPPTTLVRTRCYRDRATHSPLPLTEIIEVRREGGGVAKEKNKRRRKEVERG